MVSIIMPVYNAGIYLKDAIQDILHQTYSELELICVDDGSTDQSYEVLCYFAKQDSRIQIITQNNQGVGAARNVGMDAARGEYLLFLDADDRFESELLECAIQSAKETEADIVIFDALSFDARTYTIKDEWKAIHTELIPEKKPFSWRDCPEAIFQITSSWPWNKLLRTDFVRNTGIRYENSLYWNDIRFVYTLLVSARRISILPQVLVAYRMGIKTSVSGRISIEKDPFCGPEVLLGVKKDLQDMDVYDSVKKSFALFAAPLLFSNIDTVGEREILPYIVKLKEMCEEFDFSILDVKTLRDVELYESIQNIQNLVAIDYLCHYTKKMVEKANYLYEEWTQQSIMQSGLDRYYYDIGRIPVGSSIALYGAGHRGKKAYEMIKRTRRYNLHLWVDKNYMNIRGHEFEISNPEKLKTITFDYLIVAMDDVNVVESVTRELGERIDINRIVWA